MANTRLGVPYPVPSDPVAAGAANMQAIAQWIDDHWGMIADSGPLPAVAASISFTSIPQTFTHLRAIGYNRASNASGGNPRCQINGDATAANYQYTWAAGGTTAGTALGFQTSNVGVWSTADPNNWQITDTTFYNYKATDRWKFAQMTSVAYLYNGSANSATNPNGLAVWRSPAAITSLSFGHDQQLAAGSRWILYGMGI